MARVVAIGLDSGSAPLVDQLIKDGQLPHLAALRSRSLRVPLASTSGYRNGTLWPQFISGHAAGSGGEWLRLTFDPESYESYQESARHEVDGVPPFWEREPAVETIVFDIPRVTRADHGVQVVAWGAHAPLHPRASRPVGLLSEIDARFGVHDAFENDHECGWHDAGRLRRLTDALVAGAETRPKIVELLCDRTPDWDLMLAGFCEPHSISEFAWHGIDLTHPLARDPRAELAAESVREGVCRHRPRVGRIVQQAPADASIVVFSLDDMRSSHGDTPSIALLPELLQRFYLGRPVIADGDTTSWRARGFPPLIPQRPEPWRDDVDRRLVDPPRVGGIHGALRGLPGYQRARMSRAGRAVLARRKGVRIGALGLPVANETDPTDAEIAARRESTSRMLFTGHYQPSWPQLPAFALPSFGDGYVRINLAGRERDGVVTTREYDAACRSITELLVECRNPRTGNPVVENIEVLELDALDSRRDRYADLVIQWSEPIDASDHPRLGTIGPLPFHRTGTHADGGFAWFAGSEISAGELPQASVLDLPPTLLALLGRTSPGDLAGDAIQLRRAGLPTQEPRLAGAPADLSDPIARGQLWGT